MADDVVPYAITIKNNTFFLMEITWLNPDGTPVSLVGATGKMQIRDAPGGNLLLDATVSPSTITLQDNGMVTISVPQSVCAGLIFTRAYYDVIVVDASGRPFCVLKGPVYLDPGVTV